MTYAEKLKDPRWQRKRLEILNRDEFTCQDCGDKEKTLHVHHCIYEWGKEPWDHKDEILRTLCWECHETRGDVEHDVKLEFARMMAMMDHYQLTDLSHQILNLKDQGVENGVAMISAESHDLLVDAMWDKERNK